MVHKGVVALPGSAISSLGKSVGSKDEMNQAATKLQRRMRHRANTMRDVGSRAAGVVSDQAMNGITKIQARARGVKSRRHTFTGVLVTPKLRHEFSEMLAGGSKSAFSKFGSMLYHLSPDEMGKFAVRTLNSSKGVGVQMYLWMAAATGQESAFVAVLQKHPKFAVQLVDAVVQPLKNTLREKCGKMMLEDYGPESAGYESSMLAARVHRVDNGQLNKQFSVPLAVVPELTVRLRPCAKRRAERKKKRQMRPEVVGFDTGIVFGLALGLAVGLGWYFLVVSAIFGLSRALASDVPPRDWLQAKCRKWLATDFEGHVSMFLVASSTFAIACVAVLQLWFIGGWRWYIGIRIIRTIIGFCIGYLFAIPIYPTIDTAVADQRMKGDKRLSIIPGLIELPTDLKGLDMQYKGLEKTVGAVPVVGGVTTAVAGGTNALSGMIKKGRQSITSTVTGAPAPAPAVARPAAAPPPPPPPPPPKQHATSRVATLLDLMSPDGLKRRLKAAFQHVINGDDEKEKMKRIASLQKFSEKDGTVKLDLDLEIDVQFQGVEVCVGRVRPPRTIQAPSLTSRRRPPMPLY